MLPFSGHPASRLAPEIASSPSHALIVVVDPEPDQTRPDPIAATMHNPFWIRSYVARRYDEAAAKAAHLQHMADLAASQDLSEDIRGRARWLTIGFTLFATAVVAMRFVARRRQGAKLLIDDWLTVVTLVLCYGNMVMNIVCEWHPRRHPTRRQGKNHR